MNADDAFLVESFMLDPQGERRPCRISTGSQARAEELAAQKPGATWRRVAMSELNERERTNLERARAEASAHGG